MSVLGDVRSDLVADLASILPEDVNVCRTEPDRVPVPCAIISTGSPYVDPYVPDLTFGEIAVRHRVRLITRTGDSATETDALDDLASAIVTHYGGSVMISQPYRLDVAGVTYPALDATIITHQPII